MDLCRDVMDDFNATPQSDSLASFECGRVGA
jgi:hypothetical protein